MKKALNDQGFSVFAEVKHSSHQLINQKQLVLAFQLLTLVY
ncbi:hypothetical protein K023_3715 [Acinetobacter baumannii 25442_7]|nr:hypothetical protein J792_3630 [Acinetobacter baumannii 44895_9]EXT90451.1 hypothetical protein J765_3712 [Acinetobacter baumannii 25307_2]EXV70044.1 hypothetical protein J834_3806 [Acinetobacter baumannii 25935_1]EZI52472.1 hypothetical protein K023_3715 [Acinetobacter baumannii 25442_7]EZJ07767.1 hypothetical protein J739_3694 [Acinetobacter baumannii 24860_6]KCV84583.1 hypothetical protein J981_3690 [Acinetobacter baumannii 44298_5]